MDAVAALVYQIPLLWQSSAEAMFARRITLLAHSDVERGGCVGASGSVAAPH